MTQNPTDPLVQPATEPQATPQPLPVGVVPQGQPVPQAAPVQPAPDLIDFMAPNGQRFKIERGLYELLSAQQQPVAQPQQVQPAQQQPPLRDVWYTNPEEAARLIREEIVGELTNRYQQDRARDQFNAGWRTYNADLSHVPMYVVQAVAEKNAWQLRGMPDDAGFRKLGELVKTELFTMSMQSGHNAQPQPPVLADAGRPAVPAAAPTPEEAPKPKTLGDIINEMRKERRAGFRPPQSSGAQAAPQ